MAGARSAPLTPASHGTTMRVDRTIDRLRVGLARPAARDLGHELPRRRPKVLREFREKASALTMRGEYARGFRDALLEVVAAFEAAGDTVDPALAPLVYGPLTVSEYALATKKSLSTASRALAKLLGRGMVKRLRHWRDGRCWVYSLEVSGE